MFVFAGDMAEKASSEVTLHDIDPLALQQLVDYVYTGEIVITEENVQVRYRTEKNVKRYKISNLLKVKWKTTVPNQKVQKRYCFRFSR